MSACARAAAGCFGTAFYKTVRGSVCILFADACKAQLLRCHCIGLRRLATDAEGFTILLQKQGCWYI